MRRYARDRDADFDTPRRPTLGRLDALRLMPDFECSPDLWSIQGGILWDEVPISPELRHRVDDWHETWEHHCYSHRDEWDNRDVYEAWVAQGWLLWATINRELIPLGWIVKPDFAGYPHRVRAPIKRSPRRHWRHRFYRQPVSARHAQQIIDQSNAILGDRGDDIIAPLVARVAVVKPRRHRHWR
jgi:hypothetical protein